MENPNASNPLPVTPVQSAQPLAQPQPGALHRIPSRKKMLWTIGVILILIVASAIIYEVVITNQKNNELKFQYQAYRRQQEQLTLNQLQSANTKPATIAEQNQTFSELQKNSTPASVSDQQAILAQLQAEGAANYQNWKTAQAASAH